MPVILGIADMKAKKGFNNSVPAFRTAVSLRMVSRGEASIDMQKLANTGPSSSSKGATAVRHHGARKAEVAVEDADEGVSRGFCSDRCHGFQYDASGQAIGDHEDMLVTPATGKVSIKSMEIKRHFRSGIGRGFKRPCFLARQI